MTTARHQAMVNRVVATMALYKNIRIGHLALCQMTSRKKEPVTSAFLQGYWPLIERTLNRDHSLFCIRPLAALGYRMLATDMPELVMVQQWGRDQYEATMLERDVNNRDGNLRRVADSLNPHFAGMATRVLVRDEAWLDATQRIKATPLDTLLGASVDKFTSLPYVVLTPDGVQVQPVGPNGLPGGSPYSLNGHH